MKFRPLILCLGALLSGTALAEPADYIYVPTVEHGEREIDFKMGSLRNKTGEREQASSIGFGYGAGEHWFTEVYLKYAGGSGDPAHYDAFEWENKFQLTETGEYPVDVGLIAELERPRRLGEPAYEFRFGPLLQSEFGKVQVNGNLLFERRFHGRSENADVQHHTEIGYQWQVKYRWQQTFEYGLQGFGEMGKWNDWDPHVEQTHRFGPAVFGKLPLGNRQAIQYNAAWLIGAAPGAPDHTLRMQVEYEF